MSSCFLLRNGPHGQSAAWSACWPSSWLHLSPEEAAMFWLLFATGAEEELVKDWVAEVIGPNSTSTGCTGIGVELVDDGLGATVAALRATGACIE